MRAHEALRPLALLLALALALAGCRATPPAAPAPAGDPLPYHVAVVPVLSRPPEIEGDRADEVNLRLDSRETSRALVSELDGRAFTKATLLRYPAEAGQTEYEAWGAAEWAAWWARESSECGADLVLECDLVWAAEVESGRNGKFWAGLPLFLLGGPFCWFVDDHTYRPEALLAGRVSCLAPRRPAPAPDAANAANGLSATPSSPDAPNAATAANDANDANDADAADAANAPDDANAANAANDASAPDAADAVAAASAPDAPGEAGAGAVSAPPLPAAELADLAPVVPRGLKSVEATAPELALDYVDRAGSSVWRYLPTLVCPPGLLRDHDRRVERRLAPFVTAALAQRLAAELRGAETELAAAPRVAPFELRPGAVVVPDGELLHVLGELVLSTGPWPPPLLAGTGATEPPRPRVRAVERLDRVLVEVGAASYVARFAEGLPGEAPGELRYPFHVTVPFAAPVETVRLAVFTAGTEPLSRGYTLAVPGGASGAPKAAAGP